MMREGGSVYCVDHCGSTLTDASCTLLPPWPGAVAQPVHGDEDPPRPRGTGGALQGRRRGSRLQPGLHAVPQHLHPGQGRKAPPTGLATTASTTTQRQIPNRVSTSH